jgi:hypothetical protein
MIIKKLDQLDKYIKELNQQPPLEFFCQQIRSIQTEYTPIKGSQFDQEIKQLMKSYQDKGISEEELIIRLYHTLLFLCKKHAIHSYAYELNLEPSLYKDEMRFLFKGTY